MIKVRLRGTVAELRWFLKNLNRDKRIDIIRISDYEDVFFTGNSPDKKKTSETVYTDKNADAETNTDTTDTDKNVTSTNLQIDSKHISYPSSSKKNISEKEKLLYDLLSDEKKEKLKQEHIKKLINTTGKGTQLMYLYIDLILLSREEVKKRNIEANKKKEPKIRIKYFGTGARFIPSEESIKKAKLKELQQKGIDI